VITTDQHRADKCNRPPGVEAVTISAAFGSSTGGEDRGHYAGPVLQVETTRAARSHADKLALVTAVVNAAPGEPETDWIEWKSQLDLTTADDRFKCVKAILGFGNRDPAFARNHADGCAYFVVGAAPGGAGGTTRHDPADVENCEGDTPHDQAGRDWLRGSWMCQAGAATCVMAAALQADAPAPSIGRGGRPWRPRSAASESVAKQEVRAPSSTG
jgi:hypothetical protein